jgi:hypothetical protein
MASLGTRSVGGTLLAVAAVIAAAVCSSVPTAGETTMSGMVAQAPSVEGWKAPVFGGQQLVVSHGYDDPQPGEECVIGRGPDHCDNQRYGLDLVPAQQDETTILSPTEGTVAWDDVEGTGCLGITTADGLNLTVCHFDADMATTQVGVAVSTGGVLGWRATSWIHLSLDDRRGQRFEAVPFTGAHAIEGLDLVPNGERNQHAGTVITSSQRLSGSTGDGDRTVAPGSDRDLATLEAVLPRRWGGTRLEARSWNMEERLRQVMEACPDCTDNFGGPVAAELGLGLADFDLAMSCVWADTGHCENGAMMVVAIRTPHATAQQVLDAYAAGGPRWVHPDCTFEAIEQRLAGRSVTWFERGGRCDGAGEYGLAQGDVFYLFGFASSWEPGTDAYRDLEDVVDQISELGSG